MVRLVTEGRVGVIKQSKEVFHRENNMCKDPVVGESTGRQSSQQTRSTKSEGQVQRDRQALGHSGGSSGLRTLVFI